MNSMILILTQRLILKYFKETIAIAYAAWLESKKNEDDYIPYESETDYSHL